MTTVSVRETVFIKIYVLIKTLEIPAMATSAFQCSRSWPAWTLLALPLVTVAAADRDTRVYEVNKRVVDFPAHEDLTTPEAAYASLHRALAEEGYLAFDRLSVPSIAEDSRGQKPPSMTEAQKQRLLAATILEVHLWDSSRAVVVARLGSGGKGGNLDLRSLRRIDGRWLNEGNSRAETLELARKEVGRLRAVDSALRLRDERGPVSDPASRLRPFTDFLSREARDPRALMLDAIAEHRVVILGEIHHRPRYWAFNAELVSSAQFARHAGVIYMELPCHDQALVDRFLTTPHFDPEPILETLRDNLWMGWPDLPMLDFFRTVWETNQRLPLGQKVRIILVDMARPWNKVKERADWRQYEVDRDQFMAANIVRDLKEHQEDKRHGLFIVGYAHAMRNLAFPGGELRQSAGWHLQEKLGQDSVFAVFPHGPVMTNNGEASGRLALGLFETAFAAMGNKPLAFPLDHGPFGEQPFDADPEVLTTDPYSRGFQAYLYLGPLENELFSPLIPGFYTDDYVRELDRRVRVMEGKGLIAAGIVDKLDGPSFAAWMGREWGQSRPWTAASLGPLDAWHFGSHWKEAIRNHASLRPVK
jgi:hypothetical protein